MRRFTLVILFSGLLPGVKASADQQEAAAAAQRMAVEQAMQPSLAAQVASIRKQASLSMPVASDFFVTIESPVPQTVATATCPALAPARAKDMVEKTARTHGLRAELLQAVIQQESAFRPCAVSAKGAMGLMQLMPATAEQFGVSDPFDPDQNITAGAKLLKQLLMRYAGDVSLALSAYNAGASKVDDAGGIPPLAETTSYVQRIMTSLGEKQER